MTALSMRRVIAATRFVHMSLGATGAVPGGAAIVGAVPGVNTVLHVAGVLPPVERPLTEVAVVAGAVVPSPIWPSSFSPQHLTPPSPGSPQTCL